MREHRPSKGEKEYYSSFEEMRAAWGKDPIVKQTKDKEKLAKQRENFVKRHLCKACGQPMVYVGGNQMVCKSETCKGIAHESINDETGEKRVWYSPSFDLLDNRGAEIAENLFAEL